MDVPSRYKAVPYYDHILVGSLDNLIHAAAVLMSFEQVPQILHNSYTNTYIVAITVAALVWCAVAPQ